MEILVHSLGGSRCCLSRFCNSPLGVRASSGESRWCQWLETRWAGQALHTPGLGERTFYFSWSAVKRVLQSKLFRKKHLAVIIFRFYCYLPGKECASSGVMLLLMFWLSTCLQGRAVTLRTSLRAKVLHRSCAPECPALVLSDTDDRSLSQIRELLGPAHPPIPCSPCLLPCTGWEPKISFVWILKMRWGKQITLFWAIEGGCWTSQRRPAAAVLLYFKVLFGKLDMGVMVEIP